jgi:hypothetical protein
LLEPEFKIGGFVARTLEDSDDGVEDDNKLETQVERYPKYAKVNAAMPTKGKRGTIQVHDFDSFYCSDRFKPFQTIKVNQNRPTECLSTSGPLKIATKGSPKTTFMNADLPAVCLPLWNECYVPLLFDWAGTLANPWNYHDANMRESLQNMWGIAYPDIHADILPKQVIFVRVCVANSPLSQTIS